MKHSLFKRYMGFTMFIVTMSYVILGMLTMGFYTRFSSNEKQKLLRTNAESVAKYTSRLTMYDEETGRYTIEGESLAPLIRMLADNIDADFFVTDRDGVILLSVFGCSEMDGSNLPAVDKSTMESAMSGLVSFRSNFSGVYNSRYYCVGRPFQIIDENGEEIVAGAVFATTESNSIENYQKATFQIFLISALITFIVTIFLMTGFIYRQTKPLREITDAAREFGNGDLSIRVPVEGDDEIGELGVAFNSMANSIARSEGMNRSFIANVSHELKTPMTTIAGFVDGILDGTIPQEREKHYLRIVSDETKRLSRLVRSMLNLSRIDNGELKINPVRFDITDTVCQTLLTFEQQITEKNIEIKGLDDIAPVYVNGDQDLLHQVIYNIIENAVKFTNTDGYILISLSDSIDRASIAIENSGMGISAEELPMVFEKFYKTDKSRSRDKKGLGLGLYLCKTIIRQHGGDITVQSEENKYCRFSFYLPKPKENPKRAEAVINLAASTEHDIQDVE